MIYTFHHNARALGGPGVCLFCAWFCVALSACSPQVEKPAPERREAPIETAEPAPQPEEPIMDEEFSAEEIEIEGVAVTGIVLAIDGEAVSLTVVQSEQLAQVTWNLFKSCGDRTKEMVSPGDWSRIQSNETHIYVTFAKPVTWSETRRGAQQLDAILVPLNPPRNGAEVWARLGDTTYSPFISCDTSMLDEFKKLIP